MISKRVKPRLPLLDLPAGTFEDREDVLEDKSGFFIGNH